MHKNAMKCNETLGKWCKNKHGASKIMDTLETYQRHQKNYKGPEKYVGAAYGSYGVDTNWYTDFGATDHITGELEKLHVRDRYNGNEQIHTASGSGTDIRHIGNSVIHTPTHDLHLNNILHVPQATKSLLSTSLLARDNHAFVEYCNSPLSALHI
jgi:hypothetical protein